jgi:hypothetical protein
LVGEVTPGAGGIVGVVGHGVLIVYARPGTTWARAQMLPTLGLRRSRGPIKQWSDSAGRLHMDR